MNTVVVPRTGRAETPERWAKALDRAISNALDVYVSTDGSAFVESASTPGLLYAVSREHCTCPAGEKGMICQHRACYLAQIGELWPQEPSGITFSGSSDRQEVLIGGVLYGDAVATEYGGWDLFRGRFPNALRIGSYCTLDEIEHDLVARMPVEPEALPADPVMAMVGEFLVAA